MSLLSHGCELYELYTHLAVSSIPSNAEHHSQHMAHKDKRLVDMSSVYSTPEIVLGARESVGDG